jgi:hypothetical protein
MKKDIYHFKWLHLFIIYALLYGCINWLTNTAIYTDAFYYSSFGNQLKTERVTDIIGMVRKSQAWSYILLPLILILKWLLIAGIIHAGLIFFNQKISFADCYKVTMIAELATLAGACIKLIHFLIYKPQSSQEFQFFYPLSVTRFLNQSQVPTYLIYPLQQLNFIEIVYWLLITLGIKVHIQKTFSQSFKITASSYGVALAVWVLSIMFIQLQLS